MAQPTQNYVVKTPTLSKMFQKASNDLSIGSAVKGVTGTLYTDFEDLADNCNYALISTTDGGTQGVRPASSKDFRGYPLPSIDMNYEEIVTGSAPDEIIETFACLPTLNNKVGFEVKLRVDVLEWIGVPPPSPVYIPWVFTFNAGSTTPDSATRDGSAASLTSGKYQLNVIYELSESNPDNISVIADYIYQSAYADIIVLGTNPNPPVTLNYTEEIVLTLYTDFYKYTASDCSQHTPSAVQNVYGYNGEVTEGETLYTDATGSTTISQTKGATNVIGVIGHDWFTVSSGVVGTFNTCSY